MQGAQNISYHHMPGIQTQDVDIVLLFSSLTPQVMKYTVTYGNTFSRINQLWKNADIWTISHGKIMLTYI